MSTTQIISRIFLILLVTLSLTFSVTPTQVQAAAAPVGLSAADWAQVSALVPAMLASGPDAQQAYIKASNTGGGTLYSTLRGDSFGTAIAISGDTLVVGAPYEASSATGVGGDQADNSMNESGAVYVFSRSAGVWSQQAYIKASNTSEHDNFGAVVAISDDTLVVAAPREDSNASGVDGNQADNSELESGAVYVFTRSGGVWSQQAYLKASNGDAEDYFGTSVALSGETVVVGASGEASNATGVGGNQGDNSAYFAGAAYVFTRSGGVWSQQAYLKASNTNVDDYFGASVAISGETLVVGASGEASNATGVGGNQADNSAYFSGAAYVFTRSGSDWSQQGYIKASNTEGNNPSTGEGGDQFGSAVALSGDTLVVGAPYEDSAAGINGDQTNEWAEDHGAAYVFTRSSGIWSQQAYIKASNSFNGNVIFGFVGEDHFGSFLAILDDVLLVGAPYEDSNATGVNGEEQGDDYSSRNSGAAYVFVRIDDVWSQHAYVKASNTPQFGTLDSNDSFGSAVAISGETLVVGAPYEDSDTTGINGDQQNLGALDSGAAYVFNLPPLVVSSLRADADPTHASSVDFTVSFSEDMMGVDASDFALTLGEIETGSGSVGPVSGASITGVSGGPRIYTVSVDSGSGSGTLRLDVVDDESIVSVASSEPLGGVGAENGAFAQGQFYTIDKDPPGIFSITITNAAEAPMVDFTVAFVEPISGVDTSDFHLTMTGAVTGAHITNVQCDNYDYGADCDISVHTGQHIGTVRLDLVDDDTILDLAGNPLGGAGTGNGNYTGPTYQAHRKYTGEFYSVATQDGWVLESSENSNTGGTRNATQQTFQVGDDAANRQYKSILSFNTASLPNGAVIDSVVLTIDPRYGGGQVGRNPFKVLGNLWVDIRKGPFGTAALQATDFNAPATAKKVGYFKLLGYGAYESTLNATGRGQINKAGLTQFRLYFQLDDNNNRKADFMKFVAMPPVGNPPYLTVEYIVP